jgi:hypothetical protein
VSRSAPSPNALSSVPLETLFQKSDIEHQTSNIKHLKSDLLFKNKDDQFRTGAADRPNG